VASPETFECTFVHQENLYDKFLKMTNVVTVVSKLVNLVRSKGMNYLQFKDFLSDMESEFGNVLYHTAVHWLSRGWMFKRVNDLKPNIEFFWKKGETFLSAV
jgi:hypothetical protein